MPGSSGSGGGGSDVGSYGGVASDVIGFFGAMLAQDASTKAAQSDMAELDSNAQLAAAAAGDALLRGNVEAGRLRIRGTQAVSQQSAAYQAGGVDPTVGTPASNAGYTSAVAELDAQTAANNAAREAWGFKQQKASFERQRQNRLDQWQSQNQQYDLNQIATMGKFGLDAVKAGS